MGTRVRRRGQLREWRPERVAKAVQRQEARGKSQGVPCLLVISTASSRIGVPKEGGVAIQIFNSSA